MNRQRIASDIREIRQVFSVAQLFESGELTDGTFIGRWSGYVVQFDDANDRRWEFIVGTGVRGVDVHCRVRVDSSAKRIEVER